MNIHRAMPAPLRRAPRAARGDARVVDRRGATSQGRSAGAIGAIAPMRRTLRLAIERVTLDGPAFPSLQVQRLQASIERELSRLAKLQPYAARAGAHECLRAPAWRCDASAATDPLRLGVEIARGIHAALVGIA